MRPTRSLLHLALAASLAATALTGRTDAQTASAYGLPSEDEILPNGQTVWLVDLCHLSDSGSWVMRAYTRSYEFAVIQDGEIVMEHGDTISTGETVVWIDDVDMSPGGALAYTLEVSDGVDYRYLVYVNDVVRLSTDDTFVDPAVSPDPYAMHLLGEAAIAHPYMVVEMSVSGGGDPTSRRALVRFDFSSPLAPTAQILAEEGRPAPGGGTYTFSFGSRPSGLDVLPDGRTLAHVEVDGENAILFDGAIVARAGQPTPDPDYLWRSSGPYASVGPSGHLLLDGDVELAYDGTLVGNRIFVDDVMRVDEGQPFGSGTSGPYSYDGCVDEQGRLHFGHSASYVAGYARDDDMIMESGLCAIDGEPVEFPTGIYVSAISNNGEYAILMARVEDPTPRFRFCLVEPDLGRTVTACVGVPNSTGAVGRLEASGSSFIGAGTFQVTGADLPPGETALLLCSTTPTFLPKPAGSIGHQCLGGAIGEFTSQVGKVDADGTIRMTVDPLALPQPTGTASAMAGTQWGFQMWHDDVDLGVSTTNFTEARVVTFR